MAAVTSYTVYRNKNEHHMHTLPDENSPPETLAVEQYINEHPVTEELRQNTTLTESRPHLKIPATYRAHMLTAGVLSGPNRIIVPPFVFTDTEGKSFTSISYLGDELCGHPGIIHGGLLATLLDEGLARCAFNALPKKVAMTASLEVNYRAPCMANQAVVLKATTVKVEGRKAWVEGRIETMDGKLLAEGKALMIEPKQVSSLARLMPST